MAALSNSSQDQRRAASNVPPLRPGHGVPRASDEFATDDEAIDALAPDRVSLKRRRLRGRRGSGLLGASVLAIAALGLGAGLALWLSGQNGDLRGAVQTGRGGTAAKSGREEPSKLETSATQPASSPSSGREQVGDARDPPQTGAGGTAPIPRAPVPTMPTPGPEQLSKPDDSAGAQPASPPRPEAQPAQTTGQSQSSPEPTQPPAVPSARTLTAQAESEPGATPAVSSPATVPLARGPSPAEISSMIRRAHELIDRGDIGGARFLLDRAASTNDGAALFALAETYDPAVLAQWRVWGVGPDAERARSLYQKALERGITQARERISALR
jgi:hypothetical protein